ncbi:hypothetical protein D3C84_1148070 [compost metagenome]
MLVDIALLRHKYGVWQMAALYAERRNNVALAFFLNNRSLRFEQLYIFASARQECRRNVGKINILNQIQILLRINAMLLECEFASHLRHASFALSQEINTL